MKKQPSAFRTAIGAIPFLAAALIAGAAHPAVAQRQHETVVAFRSDMPLYSRAMRAPPEQVVQAVKAVYEQLQFPLLMSRDNPNEMFTPYLRVQNRMIYGRRAADFFGCQESDQAGGNLADHGRLTFAVYLRVRPTNHGVTLLDMQVDGRALRIESRTSAVECSSTGLLEKAPADMVEQMLRDTAPPPAP